MSSHLKCKMNLKIEMQNTVILEVEYVASPLFSGGMFESTTSSFIVGEIPKAPPTLAALFTKDGIDFPVNSLQNSSVRMLRRLMSGKNEVTNLLMIKPEK